MIIVNEVGVEKEVVLNWREKRYSNVVFDATKTSELTQLAYAFVSLIFKVRLRLQSFLTNSYV